MTVQPFADAMKARDFATLREGLAPDVVLRSPITGLFCFEGRDEVLELLQIVRDTFEDLEYTEDLGSGDRWALLFHARVAGQPIEGVDVISLDEHGRVREFTVFIRPLPGLTALAGALAPRLAGRRSRARSRLLASLVRPLVVVMRVGDRVGSGIVKAGLGRGDGPPPLGGGSGP